MLRSAVVCLGLLVAQSVQDLPAQNSTRKLRAAPSALAARVGEAMPWQPDLATALAVAQRTGKRVLWYVPTVAGSPMDRKAEIDRYLRGGPFSWPPTVAWLGEHFVPVAEVPKGALQQRYGLLRQRFIEPGYLVLDAEGREQLRVDQITTLQPEWFEAPLRALVGSPREGPLGEAVLGPAWQRYRALDRQGAIELAEAVLAADPGPGIAAEAEFLVGAALCRDQQREAANVRWAAAAARLPEQPLAWKMALEAEDLGPFGRGFEDFLPVAAAELAAPPVAGSRAVAPWPVAALWQRSVQFLTDLDWGDGVLRDSAYDFGGTDSLPNVHAAVTCLAGRALLAAERRAAAGRLQLPDALRARVAAQLERIRGQAESEAWLALSDRDEILWARAYALQFLVEWRALRGGRAGGAGTDAGAAGPGAAGPGTAVQRAAAALLALQPDSGAWFHEYANPFASATALLALHAAQAAGAEVDAERIAKGLAALAHNRTAMGAFTYGHTTRGAPRATVEAAAGRMPLCELALFVHGKSDQAALAQAVTQGFRHHGLLAAVRKYDDHADQHGYGGFFFWFDMLGRAMATMQLADAELQKAMRGELLQQVLALPEFDGVFVDSHELGRGYGTAMALLCLDLLDG